MQGLQESIFLHALGFAVLNSLWQAALLWSILSLLSRLFSLNAQSRYWLYYTSQCLLFFIFIKNVYFYSDTSQPADIISSIGFIKNDTSFIYPMLESLQKFVPYLSVLYLLMLGIKLQGWIKDYCKVQQLQEHQSGRISGEWRLFTQTYAAHFGIKKQVKIYVSGIISSPLTIGFLKPVILIPIASLNNLSPDQIEAVIIHELAHIRRADYLLNLLQSIVEMVLFFNPFIQIFSKEINRERENSCDDYVLQFQYNPVQYTNALLTLAKLKNNTALGLQATGNENGELLSRVRRILKKEEKSNNYIHQLFILLLMVIIVPFIMSIKTKETATLIPELKKSSELNNFISLKNAERDFLSKNLISIPSKKPSSYAPFIKQKYSEKNNKKFVGRISNEVSFMSFKSHLLEENKVASHYINYTGNSDSLEDSTPFVYAKLETPEISEEQAFKESYFNYLRAAGLSRQIEDSTLQISVKGNPLNKDSYIKTITIETIDQNGEKHLVTFDVTVYQ